MARLEKAQRLADQRRYGEAAREASRAAGTLRGRGFRSAAFDAYGAASKFHHLAGEHPEALAAFEAASQLLEHDLAYEVRAASVIRRLATWPELYARAAVSALELGDPLRAVTLADRGRSRAISHRLGPDASAPPPTAPVDLWERYARAWRAAVAEAANELVDEDGWLTRADTRALDEELTQIRGELVAAGVPVAELAPVTPMLDAADAMRMLQSPETPVSLLVYAIRMDDTVLRFVRLSEAGAKELVISPADQARVLTACDRYVAELRTEPETVAERCGDLLTDLVAQAGPPLGAVFEQALGTRAGLRMLWIAQGSLVAMPVQACPVGCRTLLDRAAVVVAPSLALGMRALSPDRTARCTARAIRGRQEAGKAATDGGQALVRSIHAGCDGETCPTTSLELADACGGASLVHLTCHGVYEWSDPLRTYLELGDGLDLTVEDLLHTRIFDPGTLVLLGTCDSGTVAQTAINEAIGIPVGLLGAGAHSVVGAMWPVARIAAAAICLRFLAEIADETPSPEALQRACLWLRGATVAQLHRELEAVEHPTAGLLAKVKAETPEDVPCDGPRFWASYVHWGGGWQAMHREGGGN